MPGPKRDYSNLNGLKSMEGRLGYKATPTYQGGEEGVDRIFSRLIQHGGRTQQNRMIRDKRRSLDKAVLYSYQGAFVKKYFPTEDEVDERLRNQPPVRALINPDKVKQDYDDKIISIGYEHNYQPGDVFEWVGTKSHWIIYLQDMTELAYFRGEIRRCRYTINYKDEDGQEHMTYAAIRGPVETKINYIQKNGISIDRPNYSLNILIPNNKQNFDYFTRYAKFYLKEDKRNICWRVEAIDWISTPGILQINGVEYYVNEFEDDLEKGIAGGLIVKEEDPNEEIVDLYIEGDSFIKPKIAYTYRYTGSDSHNWVIDTKYPVVKKINEDGSITVKWTAAVSGSFKIQYGDIEKTIVVESLF